MDRQIRPRDGDESIDEKFETFQPLDVLRIELHKQRTIRIRILCPQLHPAQRLHRSSSTLDFALDRIETRIQRYRFFKGCTDDLEARISQHCRSVERRSF